MLNLKKSEANQEIPYDKRATVCRLCGRKLREITTVVATGSGEAAHFRCVVDSLTEKYSLEKGQRIAYCGSGVFGVLEGKEGSKFKIIRTLSYEENVDRLRLRQEWRDSSEGSD